MKCPVCGGAELKHETRDVVRDYKDQRTTIYGLTGDFCDACGEIILESDEGDKYASHLRSFKKVVNASEVDPAFIASVRKSLKLDQREAAEIFGGGVNAFSRYETGRVAPPRPLVLLFRIIEKHPELFDELKLTPARKLA
ncbi:type II TA system antitoxin MqsA family protein [Scandinavium goeteborgense]|uniref:HTH-type transcriptional regulator/antitoxin MqsA n=1 Tax=Scandinavium goeteborgense TaxID=1851514 RepID=A0A4R6DZF4_SCAGO|nr:type II TA system antitoxin MqsA family protein [Scandinavium goeteborgense]MCS2151096.1 type II toxin-antitoxin system MqsA family antitoxin [Scandinavium goeteborgense]TDN50294.1 HTH-type transcriptional regulator/antitoxin MqsA [Scandinavium goeteborgense]